MCLGNSNGHAVELRHAEKNVDIKIKNPDTAPAGIRVVRLKT